MKNKVKLKVIDKYKFSMFSVPGALLFIITMISMNILLDTIKFSYNPIIFCTAVLIIGILTKYPHDFLHTLAAKILGLRAVANFADTGASIKSMLGKVGYTHLVIIALTPLVVWGLALSTLFFVPMPFISDMGKFLLLLHFIMCYADIMYIVYATRYRKLNNVIFFDKGNTLIIYQDITPTLAAQQ